VVVVVVRVMASPWFVSDARKIHALSVAVVVVRPAVQNCVAFRIVQ